MAAYDGSNERPKDDVSRAAGPTTAPPANTVAAGSDLGAQHARLGTAASSRS